MEGLFEIIEEKIKLLKLKNTYLEKNQFLEIHTDYSNLLKLLSLISEEKFDFSMLSDCFAADFPDRDKRFEIVYSFFSLKLNERILIKIQLSESEKAISITEKYQVANWYEREIFDLFGIEFKNHPDLRRILTDYGFNGHPLRKDFPLTGYVQVKYDEILEKVIYEPVKLDQEYRHFDTVSPWQKNPINNEKN